jgi:hypothetical protein
MEEAELLEPEKPPKSKDKDLVFVKYPFHVTPVAKEDQVTIINLITYQGSVDQKQPPPCIEMTGGRTPAYGSCLTKFTLH